MEYQKIINLLDNITNQPSRFKTKNWFGLNDRSRGTYDKDNQIRFKTSMLRSPLCDCSDSDTLVKLTATVKDTSSAGQAANNVDKKTMFKNCTSFINWIHTQKYTAI